MCGIFALLNNDENQTNGFSKDFVSKQFEKGKKRGPEFSKIQSIFVKAKFGFHRLAINGLNPESNQPITIDHISLICNGEIYNYNELYDMMEIDPQTGSDCEVIIHLYKQYGIDQTLTMLDGVFSFILCDYRHSQHENNDLENLIYIARDPYGVRPLYQMFPSQNLSKDSQQQQQSIYGFASELKCLSEFCQTKYEKITITQFQPGTYSEFTMSNKIMSEWKLKKSIVTYHLPAFSLQMYSPKISTYYHHSELIELYCKRIQSQLIEAVNKRCVTTERPVACLLSGGLDSSLIAALVNEYQSVHSPYKQLETFSIGLKESVDLMYARKVAEHLKTKHTQIILTEQEMFDAIPEVIKAIESYDTTTVRASLGNYLLGKYIAVVTDAKVIFNGDGSDELCGGYLYMSQCPDAIEFDRETRRLLKDIHLFDVLRSDKSISSHGLEPRTPFLDRNFVNAYLTIPAEHRFHFLKRKCEKYLLRKSFSKKFYVNRDFEPLLPDEILWRRKEAFSDGVSGQGRSLYQVLQEKIADHLNHLKPTCSSEERQPEHVFLPTLETEKYYYRMIFEEFYPGQAGILPYFWMPKYTQAQDPSARTLEVYQKDNTTV